MIPGHVLDSLGQEDPKSRSPLKQNKFPRRRRPREECLRFGSSDLPAKRFVDYRTQYMRDGLKDRADQIHNSSVKRMSK